MKLVFITKDPTIIETAKVAFRLDEELFFYEDWQLALDHCKNAELLFVDLEATLEEPHKIAGYERFAMEKMRHPIAKSVKVVLIAPEPEYTLDFMAGWPDFVFAHFRKPVHEKIFRRVVTYT